MLSVLIGCLGFLGVDFALTSPYHVRRPRRIIINCVNPQPFEDDEYDSGYREAENFSTALRRQSSSITDVKSAADASSRAAVAASAAAAAVAVTKVRCGWVGVFC